MGIEITSRRWCFGEPASGMSNISGLKDPEHLYRSEGEYNVTLLLINKFGCKDSLIKPLMVHGLPKAEFTNNLACQANPVIFLDRSAPADTLINTWAWNFGDPHSNRDSSSLQNPLYEYKEEGSYRVHLNIQDKNGCADATDTTITVFPSPVSGFLMSDDYNGKTGKVFFKNQSYGAENYLWDFGNGITATDENPCVTYTMDGTYTIMLVSSNQYGCTDTTYYNYEVLFKGLYIPNAFAPSYHVQGVNIFKPVGVNLQEYKAEIYDSWGHLLWSSSLLDDEGRPVEGWNGIKSNGEVYPQGTYLWIIKAEFNDGTVWEGSDIGKGEYKNYGTVTLIR
jgi:PKD repeat protein